MEFKVPYYLIDLFITVHKIWIELNWNWKKMNWIGIELKYSESDLNWNWIELKNPEFNLNWNWIELKEMNWSEPCNRKTFPVWQIPFLFIYSGIHDTEERCKCLSQAEDAGLDVSSITKQVVENIRSRDHTEFSIDLEQQLDTAISEVRIRDLFGRWLLGICRLFSWNNVKTLNNIRYTKSQNLNDSRLVLSLSLPNLLKLGVKPRIKMELEQRRQGMLQLHLSDQQVYCLVRCDLY